MERVFDMIKVVKKLKIKFISLFELNLMMDKIFFFGLSYKWGCFFKICF